MKARILHNIDGTVSVIHPAPKSRREDETEVQWLDRVFAKMTPEGVTFEDIDSSALPADRDFRNAWVKGETGIDIHTDKAREITKERLRAERKSLLEAQDVLFIKALETGADTSSIVAEKQRLRDITKIDHIDSLDDMKKIQARFGG
jgi:hypothetical protein